MGLWKLMKGILWRKPKGQVVRDVADKTWQEVRDIIWSRNYEWENFNKVIWYIQDMLLDYFRLNLDVQKSRVEVTSKAIDFTLRCPFGGVLIDDYMKNTYSCFDEMYKRNLVDRVSIDSLRVHIILEVLGKILKISTPEEFWDKKYKIWKIEINSFEDLEKNRADLQKMYDEYDNYEIGGYEEAVKYAAKNGIDATFYL